MHIKPLLFLVWCMIILGFQVTLFMNGFLLSRVSQLQNSTCLAHLPGSSRNQLNLSVILQISDNEREIPGQICVQQETKVVLLVIDAFRYDFAVFNESLGSPLYFQNKLKIIDETLKNEPEHSRLYKFVADPPTTTMQRLKGLTTGSLPTFIDAGSNFATHEINEDNVIDQVVTSNYNAIFMGDDTWVGLYPKRFLRSYPYPSFNVWDLDTVDNGVLSHLYDELHHDDWKLLIAHFLGVDHCGHRYGPNHPEMKRKLLQMNDVISNVSKLLPDGSLLFVIGDHGMTSTGDHGGESENELNAAMFVYSKSPLADSKYEQHHNVAKQVDFTPTISTLLGIPIPFSNLGSLLHNCIPAHQHPHLAAAIAAWSNAAQLMNYITEYSSSSNLFAADKLRTITQAFNGLKKSIWDMAAGGSNEDSLHEFINNVHEFVSTTRKSCEEIWIQFDAYSMARGLLLTSTISIFLYLLITGVEKLENIITEQVLIACYISLALSLPIAYALYTFNICSAWTNTLYFTSGLFALLITAALTIKNFEEISNQLYAMSKKRDWTDLVSRVLLVFAGLMLLSNSFILEESKVMLFLLLSLILVQLSSYICAKLRHNKSLAKILKSRTVIVLLIMCALLRLSMNFWRCREEQGCNNSIFLPAKTVAGRYEWLVATVASIIFMVLARMWLRSCGNLNGLSVAVLTAKFGPTTATVSIAGFWILQSLSSEAKQRLLGAHSPMQAHLLAWVAYSVIALGIASIFFQPLCVYHVNDKSKKLKVHSESIIPQLARYVFSSNSKEPPVVYGLATAYSAAFVVMVTNALLLWLLLLDYTVVPSCIALMTTAVLSLLVNAILTFEQAGSIEALIVVPSSSVMIWFVLSVYIFYGTGHQPAFPNIAWEAAFVGTVRAEGQLVNNIIPATLVIINTFGSYIIMGLSLPLLLISPFCFYVMAPNFINKKTKFALHRGELEILDHQDQAQSALYKLSLDYLMCHIFRIFCVMLSATIHCRHLMVWNVFAPKLIFEAIGLFVSMTAVCISLLLFAQVSAALNKFLAKLPKKMS